MPFAKQDNLFLTQSADTDGKKMSQDMQTFKRAESVSGFRSQGEKASRKVRLKSLQMTLTDQGHFP